MLITGDSRRYIKGIRLGYGVLICKSYGEWKQQEEAPEMNKRDFSVEARRTTRIILRLPVSICTRDSSETFDAWTLVINKHGARLQSKQVFRSNQEVGLALPNGQSATGRVIWADSIPNQEGYCEFAVELADPMNLFGVTFPPANWAEVVAKEVE
jgi:hypothetical protein